MLEKNKNIMEEVVYICVPFISFVNCFSSEQKTEIANF